MIVTLEVFTAALLISLCIGLAVGLLIAHIVIGD